MQVNEWTEQQWINATDAWNAYWKDFVITEEEEGGGD